MTLKKNLLLVAAVTWVTLSSFINNPTYVERPRIITSNSKTVNGVTYQTTLVTFDKYTTREDVIQTCAYLSEQHVQLTFDCLVIGKSLFGIIGKTRLKFVAGKIVLPNKTEQFFKAGGVLPFKSVRIQFTQQRGIDPTQIDMIEIVD
jgi:hypothetical protein